MVVVVVVIILITNYDQLDEKLVASKIQVSAIYFDDKKIIEITYNDKSNMTNFVTLEIEGLTNSFHKKYSGSSFVEDIPLSQTPQYGWKTLPVTFLVEHKEFGQVLLKIEISQAGQQPSKVIYGRT